MTGRVAEAVESTRLLLNLEATKTTSLGWQESKMEQQGNRKEIRRPEVDYLPNPDLEAAARTLTRRINEAMESTEQWTNKNIGEQNNPGRAEAQKMEVEHAKQEPKPATQTRGEGTKDLRLRCTQTNKYEKFGNPQLKSKGGMVVELGARSQHGVAGEMQTLAGLDETAA